MLSTCHEYTQIRKIYEINVFLHKIPFRIYLEQLKSLSHEYSRTYIPGISLQNKN